MALLSSIENSAGVCTCYWKISHVSLSPMSKNAEIILIGYVSEELRRANKSRLEERIYRLSGSEMSTVFDASKMVQEGNNIYIAAYGYIKANDIDFHDAEDV